MTYVLPNFNYNEEVNRNFYFIHNYSGENGIKIVGKKTKKIEYFLEEGLQNSLCISNLEIDFWRELSQSSSSVFYLAGSCIYVDLGVSYYYEFDCLPDNLQNDLNKNCCLILGKIDVEQKIVEDEYSFNIIVL